MSGPLPIDDVIDDIRTTLRDNPVAILVAPPGAGKTTRVPLALLHEAFLEGRSIKVVEPRRLAAKTAAQRMASELSQEPGQTVGYQVRLERRISVRTRIELVTDGVFRRQILDDPELSGVGAVLFDEFHERSIDTDVGFALVRDVQSALREDLRVLIMSATIDATGLADRLGGVPIIKSLGRMFPVETRYRPRAPDRRLEDEMAEAVIDIVRSDPGSLLCFLPGQGEISRTAERLEGRLPANVAIHQLSGSLDRKVQDEAIRPARDGTRKIVLATAIAETSLTIDGVRVIVDSGLSRIARFDPGSEMTRLETVRAPLSSVDQRRGRAGRTQPGLCIRLWHEGQNGALAARPEPEIRQADVAQLVLDLAAWGVTDPSGLDWLDPPPREAWQAATALLVRIGALGDDGTITRHGRALGDLPLHPRLAHMIVAASESELPVALAAEVAALLSEPGLAGRALDLRDRLRAFRSRNSPAAKALRRQVTAWIRGFDPPPARPHVKDDQYLGLVLAFAYPDRIAQSRRRDGTFKLANGKGCSIDDRDPLSQAPYAVIADVTGKASNARAQLAAPIDLADILNVFAADITRRETLAFDEDRQAVTLTISHMLGALVLKSSTRPAEPGEAVTRQLIAEIGRRGFKCLSFETGIEAFCARVGFARQNGNADLPDLTPENLLATLSQWLEPFLAGATGLRDLDATTFKNALDLHVGHNPAAALSRAAPLRIELPSGASTRIDYLRDGGPGIAVKPNEVFGPAPHPSILDGDWPLTVTLLSPAGRPLQVTRDLPGFWTGSWKDVRAELRARYPKHFWPEDPGREKATTSSVRRKS